MTGPRNRNRPRLSNTERESVLVEKFLEKHQRVCSSQNHYSSNHLRWRIYSWPGFSVRRRREPTVR